MSLQLCSLPAARKRGISTGTTIAGIPADGVAACALSGLVSLVFCPEMFVLAGTVKAPSKSTPNLLRVCTVVPVMFGKPLLNNVLKFGHVQLQK